MAQLLNPAPRVDNPSRRHEWEEVNLQGNQTYGLPFGQFGTSPVRIDDLNTTVAELNADIGVAQQAAVQEATERMEQRINALDRSKPPVTAVATTNVPLDSLAGFMIDGVATAVGDIYGYLLTGQTDPIENGIYIQTATGLVRRADSDGTTADTGYPQNTALSVRMGDIYANHTWIMTNDASPDVDGDAIYFSDATPTAIQAGAGIFYDPTTRSHNVGTDGTILVEADRIGVAPSYTAARQEEVRALENALQPQIDVIRTAEQQDRTDINALTTRLTADEQTIAAHTTELGNLDGRLDTEEAKSQTLMTNDQNIFTWASKLFSKVILGSGGAVNGTSATITRRDMVGSCQFDIPFPDNWGNVNDVGGLWARGVANGVRISGNIAGDIVTVNGRTHLRVPFSPAIADNTVRLTILNPLDSPLVANFQ